MKSLLTKPAEKSQRWFDGSVVVISSFISFISYYLINFELCGKHDCSKLIYTRFYAMSSELYLLYGVFVLIIGLFLIRNREINRMFHFSVVVVVLVGVVLSSMIVFGISSEIGNAAKSSSM